MTLNDAFPHGRKPRESGRPPSRGLPTVARARRHRAAQIVRHLLEHGPTTLRRLLVVGVVVASPAACSNHVSAPAAAPGSYDVGLWPQRPVVKLSFAVASDLHTVSGHESVVFTPDLDTCELVFRAWPNSPSEAQSGASLTVGTTTVDSRSVTPTVQAAGAPTGAPGTLVDIPLSPCVHAGQQVHAELDFQLTLGANSDEVVGYSPRTQTAWFATGYPLLSWVRGQGWTRDPALPLDGDGDFPTSEDANLSMTVTAPEGYQVMGTGVAVGSTAGPAPGTTTHQFSAAAVRDVTVSVGRFDVTETDLNGARLHLATPSTGTKSSSSEWVEQLRACVTATSALFGPFPYTDFWVTVIPRGNDGQEYPGALQLGAHVKPTNMRSLVCHEVSHQWFYALVGNNQAENPWLDEALASYGEALTSGDDHQFRYNKIPHKVVGLMGKPLAYFAEHGGSDRYDDAVYNQGAATLLEARRRVGADRFDAALRSYINTEAHQIATPASFARAFTGLPEVIDLLQRAGALPLEN